MAKPVTHTPQEEKAARTVAIFNVAFWVALPLWVLIFIAAVYLGWPAR